MTTLSSSRKHKDSCRWHGLTIIAALVAALSATSAPAQAPAAPTGAAAVPAVTQLETLVSRIALYPDDLVSIILPASTNPLQLVQADRFLEKRKSDPKAPIDEKWDDAVKTLLNYPEIVKSMSTDLDWTSDLGEAVVADQGAVLEAVQSFRRKTHAAGNLKSDQKQTVVVEKEIIKIVPADPQVIYVPQYNPSTVVVYGGYSSWGYYPAPYPSYYYPYAPGAAFATGLIWGAAIGAAWNGGHYNTNWGGGGNNTINVNRNTNVQGGNRTTNVGAGGGGQWKSNKQPGQVSSSVGKQPSGGRAGDARPGGGGRDAGGGARPSTQPAGGRDGGGAFGGAGSSGRDAHMDSSRGASSRESMGGSRGGGASAGSMQSGGARASGGGGGGGARAGGGGGGGGGARGGGGGGRGGGGGGRR
ncbi:DUF3300 domain-containing protein [Sulfurisoma sediminicola]|uniref:Uncharacterized protein DUF3300 n=1 Tax=Sulfurisoma sediminicola TaxID=1381557 RepID=A0A497XJX3_9PROT|nr:DUF3300 domain-containing protein [Sulfurisoma sediminicola]RLJ68252.1 uncharacterized protein DUF3300 [Sulfurisoma sediminicola]